MASGNNKCRAFGECRLEWAQQGGCGMHHHPPFIQHAACGMQLNCIRQKKKHQTRERHKETKQQFRFFFRQQLFPLPLPAILCHMQLRLPTCNLQLVTCGDPISRGDPPGLKGDVKARTRPDNRLKKKRKTTSRRLKTADQETGERGPGD